MRARRIARAHFERRERHERHVRRGGRDEAFDAERRGRPVARAGAARIAPPGRYTECRMERLAEEMLFDIEKDTVNMIPNFDESEKEPEVLPASFPQLLVNGTTGIGVGMATSIPPHNLGEVIDATVCLLDNPTATAMSADGMVLGKFMCPYELVRNFVTGAKIRIF